MDDGVFDRDGGKKEGRGRKRVVVLLLWPLSDDHHHQLETGHRNELANQNREDTTQSLKTTLHGGVFDRDGGQKRGKGAKKGGRALTLATFR